MKWKCYFSSVFHDACTLRAKNPQEYNRIRLIAMDAAKDPTYYIGCGREPRNGRSGKYDPEFLSKEKHLRGWYSVKLSEQDRLVYKEINGIFTIRSFKGHYTSISSSSSLAVDEDADLDKVFEDIINEGWEDEARDYVNPPTPMDKFMNSLVSDPK